MNTSRMNPYFVVFVGVISVSTSAIFVKLADAPSGVTAFYRLLFSVLIMLPVFLLKYVGELKSVTRKDWLSSIIAGVFLAFHFILWFESLNYTSVASSTVLVTLQPLFAFIGGALFFKERITAAMVTSGIIAIIGSVLISWGDFRISGLALWGDFLALIACALITFYLFFGQSVRKRVSLMTYTFIVYSVSTITLFVYVLAKHEPLAPYSPPQWIYFLLLAVVPNLLGHTLFNWSIKFVSTSIISIAILFEPVGATILAYYILGENVVLTQILGGSIVIIGITTFLLNERKVKKNKRGEKNGNQSGASE
ncbi:drug/metabolite transporter (DMT)-like permease [Bacillus oleivorans]|uniref:Drug/metabolite transporter (DMT)-like permease n=1 Tax=Bacillus oleivorans TaxID=1448271 RepID=A0A285CVZ9_9BACI|nr:drug/metabolite transporter (DMT)-like permease [Bacillus oleivorans]